MALQPRKLLGDVAALGENRDFRGDPRIENIRRQPRGLQPAEKDLPLPPGNARRKHLHTPHESRHPRRSTKQFLLEISAFPDAHREQSIKSRFQRPARERPDFAPGHVLRVQNPGRGKHRFQ